MTLVYTFFFFAKADAVQEPERKCVHVCLKRNWVETYVQKKRALLLRAYKKWEVVVIYGCRAKTRGDRPVIDAILVLNAGQPRHPALDFKKRKC